MLPMIYRASVNSPFFRETSLAPLTRHADRGLSAVLLLFIAHGCLLFPWATNEVESFLLCLVGGILSFYISFIILVEWGRLNRE